MDVRTNDNCALLELALQIAKNNTVGSCDDVVNERFAQIYANNFSGCEKIDKYCFEKQICPPKVKSCKLGIDSINIVDFNIATITLSANISNSNGNVSYLWEIDEDRVLVSSTSSLTNPQIVLDWVGADRSPFNITLTVTDGIGCIDVINTTVVACPDCVDINFSVSPKSSGCWDYVNGKFRLPIDINLSCINNAEFRDQIQSIELTSPDITVVEDNGNWFIEVDSYDEFISNYCTVSAANCFTYIHDAFNIYRIDYAPTMAASSSLVTLASGTDIIWDIAHTANRFFTCVLTNATTGASFFEEFTVSHSPTFTTSSNGVFATNLFTFPVGLFAKDNDNLVVLANDYAIQNRGEIYEYVKSTNTKTLKFQLPASYFGDGDIVLKDGIAYVLARYENAGGQVGNSYVLTYDYATGTLLSSNQLMFQEAYGLFTNNNTVYITYVTGIVHEIVFSPVFYEIPTASLGLTVGGASQSAVCLTTTASSIGFVLNYLYCFNPVSKTYAMDAPCSKSKCCEDCTLNLEITTTADCYSRYTHLGYPGYILEVDIVATGCGNDPIDLNNFSIGKAPYNIVASLIQKDGKYYIFRENSDYEDLVFDYSYVTCGQTKIVSGSFDSLIENECCAQCVNYKFDVGVPNPSCINTTETYWEVKIFCPSFDCLDQPVAHGAFTVYKNNVEIGTVETDINGECWARFPIALPYVDICGETLLMKTTTIECGDSYTYSAILVIPCGIPECNPCVDCADEEDAIYEIDLNDLCFSFNSANNKKEAMLPNIFECNGKNLLIQSMSIVTNSTGCTFSVEKRNGLFYLQLTGSCAEFTGLLTLSICWNNC